jgi:hypothetical protein
VGAWAGPAPCLVPPSRRKPLRAKRPSGLLRFGMRRTGDVPFDFVTRAHAAVAAEQALREMLRPRVGRRAVGRCLTHRQAVEQWRTAVAQAYPPGFWDAFEALRRGTAGAAGLEAAVAFLEADPWFFRSGYVKADLIRWLTRPGVGLPPELVRRLTRVVVGAVEARDRREFRRYGRLARAVASPELRDALAQRLRHPDPGVKRRARWILESLSHANDARIFVRRRLRR